jgi:hypothetical protein
MRLFSLLFFFNFVALSYASLSSELPDLSSLESRSNFELASHQSVQKDVMADFYAMIKHENIWSIGYYSGIVIIILSFLYENWILASITLIIEAIFLMLSLFSD